jgi:hypothetical protein
VERQLELQAGLENAARSTGVSKDKEEAEECDKYVDRQTTI